MAITASMVKDLREKTGAGMLDCKKALVAAEGDVAKAIDVLREKGLSKAAKKAGRIAAEGLVAVVTENEGKDAAVVEVNSETDFVAKNELFQKYVSDVAKQVIKSDAKDVESLLAEAWMHEEGKTVKDVLTERIAIIGENLNIRRFKKVTTNSGIVESYTHAGGRIGVLIELETDVVNDAVKECARNVAMQVAAIAPTYVSREEVSADYIEKEKAILTQQAKNENPDKPDNIIEKMIIGRLNKGLKEVCLVDQQYVKDGDLTVGKYVAAVAKENGATMAVKSFTRFECGEGIEKKEENFAEEVAKQLQQ